MCVQIDDYTTTSDLNQNESDFSDAPKAKKQKGKAKKSTTKAASKAKTSPKAASKASKSPVKAKRAAPKAPGSVASARSKTSGTKKKRMMLFMTSMLAKNCDCSC